MGKFKEIPEDDKSRQAPDQPGSARTKEPDDQSQCPCPPTELNEAIDQGHAFLTEMEWAALARMKNLSPRELQLIQAVGEDLKDQAIAGRLGISVHTVRTHFERVFRKLGVNSRVGLMVVAFKISRELDSPD